MPERSCSTCDFIEIRVDRDIPLFECRRYPPLDESMTTHIELIQEVSEDDDDECLDDTEPVRRFPRVEADDWCGEWALRSEDSEGQTE